MIRKEKRFNRRKTRHSRVRKKISGTIEYPRLVVFRSNKHIYAQAIDDVYGVTLASYSTLQLKSGKNDKEAAFSVGTHIAEKLVNQSVSRIVFDRGGYIYHGCVKAVADGIREAGLIF